MLVILKTGKIHCSQSTNGMVTRWVQSGREHLNVGDSEDRQDTL